MPNEKPLASESEVIREVAQRLASLLPAGWSVEALEDRSHATIRREDAVLRFRAPSGVEAAVPVEAKRIVEGRDVAAIAEQMRFGREGLIVMARYLPAPVRDRLSKAGMSWADATGNMRIAVPWPGLFIFDRGADSDPWRGPGRPRGTLKGEPAAKVVRALVDVHRKWSMRDLAQCSRASTGATYRVVQFLEDEGLVEREGGRVTVRDWKAILRRWSADYSFVRTNVTTRWIAPRGIDDVLFRARGDSPRYVVTSTVAAARWAPYAPSRSLMAYVDSVDDAAEAWGLRAADSGANVVLAVPKFDVVYDRSELWDGIQIAAPSQVAVDLMTGPGRNPSEAEELIHWMERNEPVWRR